MTSIFKSYLCRFILVFFNDVLVYSKTVKDYIVHLETALQILQSNSFVANRKKCFFGLHELNYLEHILPTQGIKMDPDKVNCILQWPVPATLKQLHKFTGLADYYCRFIRNFEILTRLLTELIKHDAF